MTGFYLHIPFCVKRCAYCDFFSSVGLKRKARYVEELISEIEGLHAQYPDKCVNTIYFGGGTPGLLTPAEVGAVTDAIRKNYETDLIETTLEINPSSAADLKSYRDAGVDRISVGVQSLNDRTLRTIGRLHTAEEAIKTLNDAKKAGFRVSADLMLALPGETEAEIARFVDAVADSAGHISAYLLKLEDDTPLKSLRDRGAIDVPDDDRQAELYEFAVEKLREHGYRRYEISNFARFGEESRHNSIYWQMDEYFGAGAGAHGFLNGKRYFNRPDLDAYLRGEHAGNGMGVPEDNLETLSERRDEAVMLALRTEEGLDTEIFTKRFGADFFKAYQKGYELAKPYLMIKNGHVSIKNSYLLLENAILNKLLQ